MVDVSLCVLTHNNPDGLYRLVDSIKRFPGLNVSIIVGDNSSDPRDQALIDAIADVHFEITDRELWDDGFGPAKQRIVSAALSDWAIIADPDEIWEPFEHYWETDEYIDTHIELLESGAGVFRTKLMDGEAFVSHGRVLDRSRFRIIGLIHEEVFSKRTRQPWSSIAPLSPFAIIHHFPEESSPIYTKRKNELYDQLVWKASQNRDLYRGTNPWWFDTYLPQRIAEGFKPMSFEEWQELGG